MKRIIMFVLLFAALKVAGQTTGYLRFDTVKIMKQNGTCELFIINKTKDSLGLLTNVGGGLTQFKRPRALNDSMIVIGNDTIPVRGIGGTGTTYTNAPGSGDTLLTASNTIKRIDRDNYGIVISTNANKLLFSIDTTQTNHLVTTSDLNDAIAGSSGGITELTGDVTAGPGSGSQAATIATNAVTDGKLAQMPGLSVKGNIGATTDDVGNITAANDGNVLRRFGTSLGFGAINLASTNAVGSSILPVANGGTGTSSPGLVNGTGISITGSWPNQTINAQIPTTLIDTKSFPPISGMVAIGDSYLDNALYTYMDNIASQFNITFTNLSVSGAQVRSQIRQLYTNTTTTPTTPLMLSVGFNNFRGRTDSTRRVETVKAAYRSIIANQFAKTFEPPFGPGGTANPKYTFSASTTGAAATSEDSLTDWGSHTYWVRHNVTGWGGANWWKKASISANETITIDSLEGSNIYIQTWACDSGYTIMSRIQYAVDGTTLGTYDPNKKSWSYTESGLIRNGIINDAIVITGLRDTLHRIVLTFLDGGKMGGIDGAGVLLSPNVSIRQPAFIPALPHMNATGYAFVPPPDGATEQSLDSATAILKAEIQSVFTDYPIYFPNENATGYYDPNDATQIQSDGIHPTSKGHYQFYLAILDEISPQKINPVVTSGASTDDLDDVTTRGASTANKISITGSSTTDSKLIVGSFEAQPYSVDNLLLTRNIYFDGSTFRWRNTGYGAMMHMNSNALALRTFGSGTGGADAAGTLATPFVVSPSSHVGLGGNMTFDDNMTGATMIVRSDNKVNIPQSGAEVNILTGTLNVGQSGNVGNATVEVTGTGYFQRNNNNSTYIVLKNGANNTAAQADYIAYNDNNDQAQLGVKSTGFTTSGTMAAGAAYLRSSGTAGLVIQQDNGPLKFSRTGSFTEYARFTGGALLINRTSAIGSELMSINGKINAIADSSGSPINMLWMDGTGEIKKAAVPSGGGNGIYGGSGSLPSDITVSTGGFTTTWSGTNDSETSFSVTNSGSTAASAINGTGGGNGTGVQGESSSGIGVAGISATGAAFRGQINPSSNNAIENIHTLLRTSSSGAGANGLGAAIQYELETATNGTSQIAGSIAFDWTDATNASRTSRFQIFGVNNTTTARKAALAGNGQWTWDGYGAGTFTGTVTNYLAVTSSGAVIETPSTSGTVQVINDADHTVTSTESAIRYHNNITGTRTVTIPDPGSATNREIWVKWNVINGGAALHITTTSGTALIYLDGTASSADYSITASNQSALLKSDGTSWYKVN